ncbi:formate/nitrite transporter family protein [Agrobacterium vitis]|nr:formate/nitrite transporter family protein [Agrobacterium vitis]
MPDIAEQEAAQEAQPSNAMSEEDKQDIGERGSGSAKVVHEVVRLQGDEELGRPLQSLLFSGFAAGVAICTSLLAEAFLQVRLPDTPWRELIVSLGYTVGFVIVILGNLQLFTETTVTAVLPIAAHPTRRNFYRLLRLWVTVLAANLLGTFFIAVLMENQLIIGAEQREAVLDISRAILGHDFATTLLLAAPAGFLIASIAWILPNAKGNEFWVIVMITYTVALGGFSHVVAGSGEAWLLMLAGETSVWGAVGGFILPTLIGNIIGGTGLFAVVAHCQVRDELKPD